MLTCTKILTFACAGLLVVSAAAAGTQGGPLPGGASDCQQVRVDRFDSLPVNLLDQETIDAVILLREEEKLARDVYLTFTALYDLPVFPNIAWSEQNHMDLVAMILERYGIADPAAGNGIGEFTNPELQDLFDDLLVPMGEASLTGALGAGATIEDLDIFHLEHILAHSEFDDINLIVQNMVAGSRNHMRGFVGALEQRGLTYEAQYIEQSLLDSIPSSPMETAVLYDENGDELAECGRRRP